MTEDMTTLFRLATITHGDKWITKREVRNFVSAESEFRSDSDYDLFPQWDLTEKRGKRPLAWPSNGTRGVALVASVWRQTNTAKPASATASCPWWPRTDQEVTLQKVKDANLANLANLKFIPRRVGGCRCVGGNRLARLARLAFLEGLLP